MEPLSPEEKNSVSCKITCALLFSILGAMTFLFSAWYNNFNSALWCIPLEVASVLVLTFSNPYLRGELHHKYSGAFFLAVRRVAVIFCLVSVCAALVYVAVGLSHSQAFDERSYFVAAIVAIVSGFWHGVLFSDTKKYESLLGAKGF